MPAGRPSRKHQDAKKAITEAAAKLFRESGYYGITVEQIAKAVHVSKVSIYYYWHGKQGILYELHKTAHKALVEGLKQILQRNESPEAKLRSAIENHIRIVCSEISPTTMALQQEYALSSRYRKAIVAMRDEYDRLFRQIITDGIGQGVFASQDPKIVSFAIIGAANYTQHWYSASGELPRDEIIRRLTDYLVNGILRKDAILSEELYQPSKA